MQRAEASIVLFATVSLPLPHSIHNYAKEDYSTFPFLNLYVSHRGTPLEGLQRVKADDK